MTRRTLALLVAGVLLASGNSSFAAGPDTAARDNDISVQTRGPVHEGYAQPSDGAPQPGLVVPKAPPEPVPELPPDEKPEGDNIQWIPGYWGWDSDRTDYLWVSGFSRATPPDRKWAAGYWRRADEGWQWVSGYWAPASQERAPLLETPPEPPESGPSLPAPDDRSIYIPGVWVWRGERYFWRPGYWRDGRPGWVWVAAHYAWTPGGCVFVDGYWDYPLETRGVLFAPVCFERPLWERPGWCYRPRFVVSIGQPFFSALFVCPSRGHYYFGDYYDRDYLKAGYQPWCQYGPRHHDPLFSYYHWAHRDEPAWLRGVGAVYAGRRAGELSRPSRTLVEQAAVVRRAEPSAVAALTVVQPLADFRGGRRLTTIDRAQVAQHQAAAVRTQESARQRVQSERPVDGKRAAAVAPAGRVPSDATRAPDVAGRTRETRLPPAPPVTVNPHADRTPPRPLDPRPAAAAPERHGGRNPTTDPATKPLDSPPPPQHHGAPAVEHGAPVRPTPPSTPHTPTDNGPPRRQDARPLAPAVEHGAPLRPAPPSTPHTPADNGPPRRQDAPPPAPVIVHKPAPAAPAPPRTQAPAPVASTPRVPVAPARPVSPPPAPRPAPTHAAPPARQSPPPQAKGQGDPHHDHKKK